MPRKKNLINKFIKSDAKNTTKFTNDTFKLKYHQSQISNLNIH